MRLRTPLIAVAAALLLPGLAAAGTDPTPGTLAGWGECKGPEWEKTRWEYVDQTNQVLSSHRRVAPRAVKAGTEPCPKPEPPPEPVLADVPADPAPASGSGAPVSAPVSGGGCPSYMAGEASSPTAVNPSSGAAGCFQVIPSTAAAHGCAPQAGASLADQMACAAKICATSGNGAWVAADPCGQLGTRP